MVISLECSGMQQAPESRHKWLGLLPDLARQTCLGKQPNGPLLLEESRYDLVLLVVGSMQQWMATQSDAIVHVAQAI